MEQVTLQKKRLYNIDALRILSMYFVCILHVGGTYGGMSAIEGTAGKAVLAFIITLSDVAVNCFIMITAYVAGGREWKVGRYLKLYFQVAFYCVGFSVLYCLFSIFTPDSAPISWEMLLGWNLPLPFASAYWYFVAYSALFLLAPFIDKLLRILNRKQFILLLAVTVGVIVIQGIIPPYQDKVSGYSLYGSASNPLRLHGRPQKEDLAHFETDTRIESWCTRTLSAVNLIIALTLIILSCTLSES